jgi:hypothetical protein
MRERLDWLLKEDLRPLYMLFCRRYFRGDPPKKCTYSEELSVKYIHFRGAILRRTRVPPREFLGDAATLSSTDRTH